MIFKFVKGLSNQYTKNLRSQLGDDDMKENWLVQLSLGFGDSCVFAGQKCMSMMSILHTLHEYLIHKGSLARLYACYAFNMICVFTKFVYMNLFFWHNYIYIC
jgi:hypothetical protein